MPKTTPHRRSNSHHSPGPAAAKNTARPQNTSLYLDTITAEILAARDLRTPTHRSKGRRSQLLRAFLRRYDEICREDLPAFSHEQWHLLLELGRDWLLDPAQSAAELVKTLTAATGADAQNALAHNTINQFAALSAAQRTATVDFVLRYWAAKTHGAPPLPIPHNRPQAA